jgi:hypothetical protein
MLHDRKPSPELHELCVKPKPVGACGTRDAHGKKRYLDFTMYIYGNKKIHADSEHSFSSIRDGYCNKLKFFGGIRARYSILTSLCFKLSECHESDPGVHVCIVLSHFGNHQTSTILHDFCS